MKKKNKEEYFIGQRSQIYIRIKDRNNNKTLLAKYYSWNYGERMISRARYGIEYIKRNSEFNFHNNLIEKTNRMFDVNYDMIDVQLSHNILKDFKDIYIANEKNINDYIFLEQANNDGKLFVDYDQNSNGIKYCFTDSDLNILSAQEYMKWNIDERWDKKDYSSDPDWKEIVNLCKKNIKVINENARIMSDMELKQFINDNYTKQINEICLENKIKI